MNFTCRHCNATITGHKPEHCTVCHETFTGTRPGDMHRVGRHGITEGPERRRCLTPAEMTAKGMTQDRRGYWTTGQTFENAAKSLRGRPQTA